MLDTHRSLQLPLFTLVLQDVCRSLARQLIRNCICSHNIVGALGMVVGLIGLYGFGSKSKLVVLGSRVLAGFNRNRTLPSALGCPFCFAGSGLASWVHICIAFANLSCMAVAALLQPPGKYSNLQDWADRL